MKKKPSEVAPDDVDCGHSCTDPRCFCFSKKEPRRVRMPAEQPPEVRAPEEVLCFVHPSGKLHPEMYPRSDYDEDELVGYRDLAKALGCDLVRYVRAREGGR